MKLGQTVYYIDSFTREAPGVPNELDQFHHIKEGRYLSEDSDTTALATVAATYRNSDEMAGRIIFLPNNQVTEDDDIHGHMKIINAILARNDV